MRKERRRKRLKRKYIPLLLLIPLLIITVVLASNWFKPEVVDQEITRPVVEEPEPIEEEPIEEIEPQEEIVTEEPKEEVAEEPKEPDYESVTEVSVRIPTTPVKEEPKKEPGLLLTEATGTVFTVYSDTSQGSGFLYNAKGDIITNAHVVRGSYDITVKNNTGQTFHGYVAGVSLTSDLALIRVPDLAGKQPMQFASTMAPVNTEVTAVGSPNDKANTATSGKITATNVRIEEEYVYENLYEMTASIAPGSSGGPLFRNDTGEVIGINSIVGVGTETYGYAIPIHLVSGILTQFSKDADSIEQEGYEPPQDREDAYLSDELLTAFASDFSELFYMYLLDETKNYYIYSLTENSPLIPVVEAMRQELLAEASEFSYQANRIDAIEIVTEQQAFVSTTLVYSGMKDGEQVVLERPINLKIEIDEFGDYKITDIQ
ncbi:S1C family serine protease [Chryseomicrobium aureum]|uniref:S1C family serine protease n=1 Tax=Chryseomicrobium aureum TaxID=1441723 RepID=UPI00370DD925